MSGKQMKKLRREAERRTVGKKWLSGGVVQIKDDKGRQKGFKAVLSPESGRGIYQGLKKETKDGSR